MLSKKTIAIIALIAIVAVGSISTTFVVMSFIASNSDDHIYVVEDVVDMPYTIAGYKGIGCWAETFIEWEFNSSKPHINLYIQLENPNNHVSTLTWGTTTYASGLLNVTALPGDYHFRVWNLDDNKERVNITFRLRYDNPWWKGEGTPGW